MDKNKLKIMICSLVVLIFATILCVKFTTRHVDTNNENSNINTELNSQKEIISDGITRLDISQTIDGLHFSNVEIEMTTDTNCELRANVVNTTMNEIESKIIKITVTDDTGNLREVFGGIVSSIPAEKTGFMISTIRKDIRSATNVNFEIVE